MTPYGFPLSAPRRPPHSSPAAAAGLVV
uniref:Uncharacterized protein n=1 Tax=Arundo donax TaxID=35708 RepID=A0A0A9BG48_ARUDO